MPIITANTTMTITTAPITAIAIIHPLLRPVVVVVGVEVGAGVPDVIDGVVVGVGVVVTCPVSTGTGVVGVEVGVVVTCPVSTGAGVVVGVVIDGGIYITLKTVKWLTWAVMVWLTGSTAAGTVTHCPVLTL